MSVSDPCPLRSRGRPPQPRQLSKPLIGEYLEFLKAGPTEDV